MAVFENFPYTNVHELNLNWVIDQMKNLLDEWDAFTTSVDATAQSGSVAGVEVVGSLKEGLTFKFTLPKGDKGDVGNTGNGISTVTYNPNYSLTFNFTDGTSYTTPSLRGAQGEGLKINDTYPTLQDLETAHPTGVEGDAYLIGTDPNFILYIWSTRLNDYAMVGALTSPQPSETTPLMDGVANNGSEFAYARGDHRHPSDTTKVNVTTFNEAIQDVLEDINTINGTIQIINDNISTIENNITTIQNNFADSETSPSTHSYSVGQYLVYNRQLYKVKTAISVGENLVVGTNIETTSVGDELTTIENITLTNGADHSQISNEYTVSLQKIGKLCILNLDIKFGTVTGNQCIGYVIPVGARPSFSARGVMTQWKSNAYSAPLSISNEGLVAMAYVQSNTEYSGQAVWFC